MIRRIGTAAVLALAMAMPVHDAVAQDVLGGAILGGAGGAILGGALGGGRGAAIGAVIGAGTGAAIASEGERRRSGYYYYHSGCYLQRGDGAWVRVSPRYCY
jgi:outer membrane protein with glycine zipper